MIFNIILVGMAFAKLYLSDSLPILYKPDGGKHEICISNYQAF